MPDLRPSQESRNVFQLDSSWMAADSRSKRERISAKSGATWFGCVAPIAKRVRPTLFETESMDAEILSSWGAARCAPTRKLLCAGGKPARLEKAAGLPGLRRAQHHEQQASRK